MAAPLVVIVGETASGKSALSLRIAEQYKGEIICADAWTVRREADIGTAKPSKEDQKRIRHHLLDIIGPDEKFSAAEFKRLASAAIEDIASRNKLPIMVGGSGLYIDGVIYDYSFLPTGDPSLRLRLNNMTAQELLSEAGKLGIDLSSTDVHNKRRLVRLIETKGTANDRQDMRQSTLLFGLKLDGPTLRKKITERVDYMLNNGLEDEVLGLSRKYGWDAEALKAIDYREWQDYFKGLVSKQTVRENIISNNLELARKQRTWFKRNKSIHWLNTPVDWTTIVESMTTFLRP